MPDQRDDEPAAPPFDPAHQVPSERSGENPNIEPSPPDPDAPGRSVSDTESPEAVEPNEPA